MTIKGQPVPHLYDALAVLSEHDSVYLIEPKAVSTELIQRLTRAVADFNLGGKVTVITFAHRSAILKLSKQLDPSIRTGVILINPWAQWLGIAKQLSANMILPGWKGFNHLRCAEMVGVNVKAKISEAQMSGVEVYSGIANTPKDIVWLYELGVDGIITDTIETAQRVLNNHRFVSRLI
jgi:glycerophosphoryl diester phosphodiesterase